MEPTVSFETSAIRTQTPGNYPKRNKLQNMTSLFPIRKTVRKPPLTAKEIREELAAYFLSGGRVEWQNDCA